MTTFKNVSGVDLEVWVNGAAVYAPAGDVFDVPDEHADGLRLQPNFKEQTAKAEKEKN